MDSAEHDSPENSISIRDAVRVNHLNEEQSRRE
jgi:hypothetical protein